MITKEQALQLKHGDVITRVAVSIHAPTRGATTIVQKNWTWYLNGKPLAMRDWTLIV